MVDLTAGPILDNPWLRAQGLDAVPVTAGDVAGASAEQALHENLGGRLFRVMRDSALTSTPYAGDAGVYFPSQHPDETSPVPLMPASDANSQYGIQGHLKFDNDLPEQIARERYDATRAILNRQSILARDPGTVGSTLAKFGAGMGASLADPIQDAAMFIPFVGEARTARWMESAGQSFVGRAGVRAGIGAINGAAGTAIVQPAQWGLSKSEGEDFNGVDALMNIAYGGVGGAVLHSAFGLGRDLVKGIPKTGEPGSRLPSTDGVLPGERERTSLDVTDQQPLFGSAPDKVGGDAVNAQAQGSKGTIAPHENDANQGNAIAVDHVSVIDDHMLARQIDPDTFRDFEALDSHIKDIRGQIDAVPDAVDAQIADMDARAKRVKSDAALVWQKRADELRASRDDVIATQQAALRQGLQDADYQMRDLAPHVTAAYVEARARLAADGLPIEAKENALRSAIGDLTRDGQVSNAAKVASDFLPEQDGQAQSTPIRPGQVKHMPNDAEVSALVTANSRKALDPASRLTQDLARLEETTGRLRDAGVIPADDPIFVHADALTGEAEGTAKAYETAANCLMNGGML